MTSGIIDVVLSRDGPGTPWGFRLHGGKDIGYPLVVQRVFVGTTADGELQRGDTLLQIQGRDTTDMSHMQAHDLIKAAGNKLQLLLRRVAGGFAPITPTSPISMPNFDGMHPYVKLLKETAGAVRAPAFQPMSPPRVPFAAPAAPHRATSCFSPLPTTPVFGDRIPFFTPSPRNLADAELMEYRQEKYKEKDAITNQGYRTLPLIAPKPKTRHDIPMGSYLRHKPDPNWIGRSTIQPSVPNFNKSLPTPTYSTIGHYSRRPRAPPPGAPMFEKAIDDNTQLVHHQYNSPMFLYSQSNIENTIHEQTGLSSSKPHLSVSTPAVSQPGPPSPGGNLAPAKAGTRLSNIVDITLSPTFQMIQETETRSSSPMPDSRSPVPMRKVPGPVYTGPINTFGCPREVIHQSGSFKTLMSSLSPVPPVE